MRRDQYLAESVEYYRCVEGALVQSADGEGNVGGEAIVSVSITASTYESGSTGKRASAVDESVRMPAGLGGCAQWRD